MAKRWRGVIHWDPEAKAVREGPAPTRPADVERATKLRDEGGVSFQIPEDWDDGSGKVRHIKDGPLKGRVFWSTRQEKEDIARRLEDTGQTKVRPDQD